METSPAENYTAKLIDGPLEGKTISQSFLDSGDPQSRLKIPAGSDDKFHVYARGSGAEYDGENDDRPTAVEYRFLETVFD